MDDSGILLHRCATLDRVVLVISIYTSLLYAIIYDFFVIIPFAFATIRGFKPESIGLIYITLFIGFAMAASNYLFIQEGINRRLRAKSGKTMLPPETSLIHAIYGCALAPVGLFLFAWTVPFTSKQSKMVGTSGGSGCICDADHCQRFSVFLMLFRVVGTAPCLACLFFPFRRIASVQTCTGLFRPSGLCSCVLGPCRHLHR